MSATTVPVHPENVCVNSSPPQPAVTSAGGPSRFCFENSLKTVDALWSVAPSLISCRLTAMGSSFETGIGEKPDSRTAVEMIHRCESEGEENRR
jgi:hypothetical protein